MCTDTITRACDINALDRLCTGDNRYIPAQITHCNQPANTGSPDCQHFATTSPCLENPFLEYGQCEAAFDNPESAKQARFDYCNGENPIASLCTGAQTICSNQENLFATNCDAFNNTARLDYCATGTNALLNAEPNPQCVAIQETNESCVSNPFADVCTTILTDAPTIRQGRVNYCHTLTPEQITANYLCANLDQICRESPFEKIYGCLNHTAWEGDRDRQAIACRADQTRQSAACTGPIRYCFQNPFDAENKHGACTHSAFHKEREARVLGCYNGTFSSPACEELAPCNATPFSTTITLNETTCNTAPEFAAIRTIKIEGCSGADFANFSCNDVQATFCTDSNTDNYLFSPLCNRADNPYQNLRTDLIDICISNSSAEGCTDNINHCVLNPYKLYITCVNTAFDTHRTTSVTNCISNNQDNGGIQTSDTFCRNIDRAVCTHIGRFANPFHELCYLNSTNKLYATRRYTIFNNCIGGTLRGQTCKVVIACTANPFGSECPDDALFDDAKETYCRANSTDLCNPTIERVCATNALDDLCTGDSRYDTPRITACREDQSDNKCAKIIKDVCDVTPLDTLCAEDNRYTDARQTACRAADLTTETRCGTAIMQICDANLRDPICDKDARYQDTHRDACRQSLNNPMCVDTITRACDINALDRLCTGDNRYIPAQITHCNQPANTGSPDCQHFATTSPCLENPFLEGGQCETAFDNLDSAKQARFDYCNGESPIASLCTGAQTICEQSENLFAPKCDAFNTTARVDYCATGSNTLMGDTMQTDPKCTDTNIPAQSCVSNPFADICTTILTDAETIRQGRVSYCHTLTRAEIRGSYLCSSLDIICRESPFENVLYRCLKHSAWAGHRDHQVSTCRADETRQAAACTNFIQYCFQNPFDTANKGFCKDPAFNQEREARVLSCYNGRFIGSACDALAPCSNAPFSTTLMLNERTCNTAPEFAAIRTMKAENCNGADFANFPCDNVRAALCTDSNTDNYLFSPLCNRADNPYHQVRKNLIQACQNNSNLQGCTETILLCLRKGGYETDTTCVNSAFNSHRDGQTSQCTATYRDSGSIHEDDISCIAIDTALCTDTGPYANPFHDICRLTGVDYSAERTAIFNGCRDGMLSGTICEPVTFCMTYPFGSDCRSDPLFETARETYCRANSNTTCNSIVERLCTADVLDDICADDTRYSDAHETACRGTPEDSRCAGVIAQLCDAEALDDICASDSRYSDAHETACRGAPEDSRCADTITQICDANALDDLCTGDSRYDTPRIAACREDQSDKKCKKIVKDVCDASPLDTLCADDNRYKNARKEACRAADLTTETRCGEAIMQICDANLRDEICDKDDRYQANHRAACRQTANNPQCATTITTICTGDPFDSACISNPLYHRARLIDCITAANTRESRCTAMTEHRACFENPFSGFV